MGLKDQKDYSDARCLHSEGRVRVFLEKDGKYYGEGVF
jgi:hypothetical protein